MTVFRNFKLGVGRPGNVAFIVIEPRGSSQRLPEVLFPSFCRLSKEALPGGGEVP